MNLRKFLILLVTFFGVFYLVNIVNAANIDVPESFKIYIEKVSSDSSIIESKGSIVNQVEYLGVSLLRTFKVVIEGLLLLFIVYAGAMMIMSQGNDEEELSGAKRYMWHAVVALIFINIPGDLYESFIGTKGDDITGDNGTFTDKTFGFINSEKFFDILQSAIQFTQVIIFFVAVLLLSLSAVRLILSRGREDVMKEHKNNIFYSILGLVFVWLINVWRDIVFNGRELQQKTTDFFSQMSEFVLLFAGPIAIFFLIMAGYYFITANGDEDKIKKGKSIIVNVVLGTIILLMSYTFLLDLQSFKIN